MIALLFLVALGAGDPAGLEDGPFRFCTTPGADASSTLEFCELLDDLPDDVCPGMRETCNGAEPLGRGCDEGSGGGGAFSGFSSGPDTPKAPIDLPTGCEGAGLAALFKWIAAIAVAVGLLVLFRVLMKTFGRAQPAPETPSVAVAAVPADLEAIEEAGLPSDDLLAGAKAALAEGRLGEAVLLSRGAALRGLGDAGKVRLHRSRTDREYVRQVRRVEGVGEWLREVVAAVETHKWAGHVISSEQAQGAVAAAGKILSSLLLLLMVMPAYGQTLRYEAYGDVAISNVLTAHGFEVTWREQPLADLIDAEERPDALLVDVNLISFEEEELEALRAYAEEGGVVVAFGDASLIADDFGDWLVGEVSVHPSPVLLETPLPAPKFAGGSEAYFTDSAVTALMETGDGEVVAGFTWVGEGVVVGIADVRLGTNASMVHPDNVAFLGDLLWTGQGHWSWPIETPSDVQLALIVSVGGAQNSAASVANAKMLPFVIQLLLLWLAAAWWKGFPFGRPRSEAHAGRGRFSEHARALAIRYERVGATRHVASAFSRLWVAKIGGAGVERAARAAGYSAENASAFREEVEAVADQPEGTKSERDLQLVEELWKITKKP